MTVETAVAVETDGNVGTQRGAVNGLLVGQVIGFNLLGEYDFSDEKLRDSVGIPPPKIIPKSLAKMGGRKSL